jgi:hypothetical protein
MTGTTSQSDVPEELASIREAARRGDLAKVADSIDFGVTGVARFVRALWQIEPTRRDCIAEQGLAELEDAQQQTELAQRTLSRFARSLATASVISAVDADAARRAVEGLRGPEPPPDLSPELLARVSVVRERARSSTGIYTVNAQGEQPVLIGMLANHRVAICPRE